MVVSLSLRTPLLQWIQSLIKYSLSVSIGGAPVSRSRTVVWYHATWLRFLERSPWSSTHVSRWERRNSLLSIFHQGGWQRVLGGIPGECLRSQIPFRSSSDGDCLPVGSVVRVKKMVHRLSSIHIPWLKRGSLGCGGSRLHENDHRMNPIIVVIIKCRPAYTCSKWNSQ